MCVGGGGRYSRWLLAASVLTEALHCVHTHLHSTVHMYVSSCEIAIVQLDQYSNRPIQFLWSVFVKANHHLEGAPSGGDSCH